MLRFENTGMVNFLFFLRSRERHMAQNYSTSVLHCVLSLKHCCSPQHGDSHPQRLLAIVVSVSASSHIRCEHQRKKQAKHRGSF